MKKNIWLLIFILGVVFSSCTEPSPKKKADDKTVIAYSELYRPQVHFTPPAKWMNDPNGMVYFDGEYHLFYQYYPDSTVWGPMHWGHAVSKDLMHWEHLPIALYPDSLGYIFSGSAVVDDNNTSGFGKDGKVPLVALFTYHNMKQEKAGRNDYQTQGIAFSLDKGRTWEKYKENPVLKNPGIRDFRDPKVSWNDASKKWILTLATLDCITFFSSPDLKNWTKQSEFGKGMGGHSGVWECPDLFPIKVEGSDLEKWVLLVSINPGGPNGGSATQYFVGNFDGKVFTNERKIPEPRWIDSGKDNYAGVTWSGIPKTDGRRLFLGWMSNWQYATVVPTQAWRSAMTIPRELKLVQVADEEYAIKGYPTSEFENYGAKWDDLLSNPGQFQSVSLAQFALGKAAAFDYSVELDPSESSKTTIQLSNNFNETFDIVLDKTIQQIRINRMKSGDVSFNPEFQKEILVPVNLVDHVKIRLVIDQASVEMFIDGGLTEITNIVFPKEIYNKVDIRSDQKFSVFSSKVRKLNSIWH